MKHVLLTAVLFGFVCALPKKNGIPHFTAYSVSGMLYIPYAELKEPFTAWYDEDKKTSRIDYYGGMTKTYQFGSRDVSFKVFPVSTEKEENVQTCRQIRGSDQLHVSAQSIFPDPAPFEFVGTQMLDGHECEKWMWSETHGAKVNKYILYLRYKKSHSTGQQIKVPVMYEMKGYNILLGSHYDHYYLKYLVVHDSRPDDQVFDLSSMNCSQWMLNDENSHVYTFNPMKEFVHNYDSHMEAEFENFKNTHQRQNEYKQEKEHLSRKETFRQNMRFIQSKNRANLGYTLTANHLADRTISELKSLRGRLSVKNIGRFIGQLFKHNVEKESKELPESLDWRLHGAVTPVKDQSICGSCWSFSTTGAIEGAYFLKHDKLVTFSEQALIDCSWGVGNNGCDGGLDFHSFEWILKVGGLPASSDYGDYLGQDGHCHIKNVNATAKMTGYVRVPPKNVKALKVALFKHGPVAVSIDASLKSFAFYSHGVYHDKHCGNTEEQLDHAVLAVGYGTLNGKNYWLVKNSWSNYWGNDGYILISQDGNDCGVTLNPNYVTVQ